MWLLRFYSPDDELQGEVGVPGATLAELTEVLGYQPTTLGSTSLSEADALRLGDHFQVAIPKGLDAFLDFDEEGEIASSSDRREEDTSATNTRVAAAVR